MIGQVKQSSEVVSTAARETSLGNQDLSQRTEEQASSLEEISSTIEEIASSLQQSSDDAGKADKNSKATMETVRKGEAVVNELHQAMREITDGSHVIAQIIAKVNDIAFQTNLLALNAAVEAARAGEQGRGFAVVAAEVRNLAGRTDESSKEIENLIKGNITKVEQGNVLMEQTAAVLRDIINNTQKTAEINSEIASAVREQSTAADDIRSAVEQLNQVTQQNASLVEEIAGASESVNNEAEDLNRLVLQFKIAETDCGQRSAEMPRNREMAGSRHAMGYRQAPAKTPNGGKRSKDSQAGRKGDLNQHRGTFEEEDFERF